jgi:hypothetical protein
VKKNFCLTFFVATKIKKSKIVLILKWCRKYLGQFTKKYRTFYPKKLSLSSQKYGFGIRDPESKIRDPEKRGQKGTATQMDGGQNSKC